MEQLDLLWRYQELDILVDNCENKRRNSTLRQKLIEIKNYLTDQQAILLKLDTEADKKNNELNHINTEYESCTNVMMAERRKLGLDHGTTLVQLEKMRDDALEIKEMINRKSQELTKLLSELKVFEKKLDSINTNVVRAKKEYTGVKVKYDEELEVIKKEYAELKHNRDELGVNLDPSLLNRYVRIKDRRSTAVAMIENDRCGGCNMKLAAVLIQIIKDGNDMIECENCGRLLYQK